MKYVSYHRVAFGSDSALGFFGADGLDEICLFSSGVDPTAGDPQILSFVPELVVDLISISNHSPGKAFQEVSGMISPARGLPII